MDSPCGSVARVMSGETELSQGGEETEGIELYPSVVYLLGEKWEFLRPV